MQTDANMLESLIMAASDGGATEEETDGFLRNLQTAVNSPSVDPNSTMRSKQNMTPLAYICKRIGDLMCLQYPGDTNDSQPGRPLCGCLDILLACDDVNVNATIYGVTYASPIAIYLQFCIGPSYGYHTCNATLLLNNIMQRVIAHRSFDVNLTNSADISLFFAAVFCCNFELAEDLIARDEFVEHSLVRAPCSGIPLLSVVITAARVTLLGTMLTKTEYRRTLNMSHTPSMTPILAHAHYWTCNHVMDLLLLFEQPPLTGFYRHEFGYIALESKKQVANMLLGRDDLDMEIGPPKQVYDNVDEWLVNRLIRVEHIDIHRFVFMLQL